MSQPTDVPSGSLGASDADPHGRQMEEIIPSDLDYASPQSQVTELVGRSCYGDFIRRSNEKCAKSVVLILFCDKKDPAKKVLSFQTGIIIASGTRSCCIITSLFAVTGDTLCQVQFCDGRRYPFSQVCEKKEIGMSIFKVNNVSMANAEPAKFADSPIISCEKVFTCGYSFFRDPTHLFSLSLNGRSFFSGSIASGVGVKNKTREQATLFVHGCATGHNGDLGSAVFNERLNLVGMNILYTFSSGYDYGGGADFGGIVSALDRASITAGFASSAKRFEGKGFHKVHADRWEFAHEGFLRGSKHLLKTIVRRRSSPTQQSSLQPGSSIFRKTQPSSSGESTLDPELQSLRREKNALLQEVARLKEHIQTIEHMNTLNQKLDTAEDRQKHVVSFLAKLLQNPAFLRQLKMHKERREEIDSARVKRKFLKHAPHGSTESGDSSSPRTGESCLELPACSPAYPIAHDAIADLQNLLLEDTDLSDGMLPGNFELDGVHAPEDIGALVQGFDTQDELDLGTGAELLGMTLASGTAHCQDSAIGRSKGKNVMCPGLDGASSEADCLVSLPDNMWMVSADMAGKLVDPDDGHIWDVDAYLQSSCSATAQQAYGSLASDPYLMEIANKPGRFWEIGFEALDDGDLHLDKCVIGDPALEQHRGNMKP